MIDLIKVLKKELVYTEFKISLTLPSVAVYPSPDVPTPGLDESGIFWNFMVPVVNNVINYIDLIQVETYRNSYLEIDWKNP